MVHGPRIGGFGEGATHVVRWPTVRMNIDMVSGMSCLKVHVKGEGEIKPGL